MQEQTKDQSQISQEAKEILNGDILRALFSSQITSNSLEEILAWDGIPQQVKDNAQVAAAAINALKTSIKGTVSTKHHKWLDTELGKDKLRDTATLIETVMRIGAEADEETYEEFLGLVVDLLHAIFYAQTHRKHIYFSKYKALFKLISDELRADTNKQPGQIWYRNGDLWIKAAPPDTKTEVQ